MRSAPGNSAAAVVLRGVSPHAGAHSAGSRFRAEGRVRSADQATAASEEVRMYAFVGSLLAAPVMAVGENEPTVSPSSSFTWFETLLVPLLLAAVAGVVSFLGARAAFRREVRARWAETRQEEQRHAAQRCADLVYEHFKVEHDLMLKSPDERIHDRWEERQDTLLELRRCLTRIPASWRGELDEVVDTLHDYDDVAQWTGVYSPYGVLAIVHRWTDELIAAFLDGRESPPDPPEELWIVRLGLQRAREDDELQRERPDMQAHDNKVSKARQEAIALRDSGTWRPGRT